MTTVVSSYKSLFVASLVYRAVGREEMEDHLDDEMTNLWFRMSEEQQDEVDAFTSVVTRSFLNEAGDVVVDVDVLATLHQELEGAMRASSRTITAREADPGSRRGRRQHDAPNVRTPTFEYAACA